MIASLGAALQHLLPQRLLGRIVYRAARSENPRLKNLLVRWFARHYRVDLSEAAEPDPAAYRSFNEFFTRALQPAARPIAGGTGEIVSPADGRLTEFGALDGDRLLQAKGLRYTLAALLGEDDGALEPFVDGSFATIYLAPHDYHRVHAPLAGTLSRARYLPGKRFSVNRATAAAIPNLFCRNERLTLWLEGDAGPYVLVMVGALNVSSISTVVHGEITSGPPQLLTDGGAHRLARGAEIGRFNLGSTVIAVFPRGSMRFDAGLAPGAELRMGERLGRVAGAAP